MAQASGYRESKSRQTARSTAPEFTTNAPKYLGGRGRRPLGCGSVNGVKTLPPDSRPDPVLAESGRGAFRLGLRVFELPGSVAEDTSRGSGLPAMRSSPSVSPDVCLTTQMGRGVCLERRIAPRNAALV